MKNIILAALLFVTVAVSAQCSPSPEKKAPRFTLNDSVVSHQMASLSQRMTVPLQYNNEVRAYIDLYVNRRNEQTNQMLSRSYTHFPIIEELLQKHGLPNELKYYAMVESALNPQAKSRSGCLGLWQLSSIVVQQFGLRDEDCFDAKPSTEIACHLLEKLYAQYGDWLLALSAYDLGTAMVDRAIAQANGSHDYWAIRDHLPKEARGYIPAFMAITYVMNHANDFGLHP